MRSRLVVLLLVLVAPLLVTTPIGPTATASPGRPGHLVIEVLSNRADLVSAGDALVAVRIPHGVRPGQVRVTVGDRDVTTRFAVRADGQFVGLVRGLEVGRNVIGATAPGARRRPGRGDRPPERRPGLLRPADPALPLPGDRARRAVQRARDRTTSSTGRPTRRSPGCSPTTRPTRRPTSRRRPPTRASRCRSSCAASRATRTATGTRSSRSSAGQAVAAAGRRSSSGTTSCSSPTAAAAARRTPRATPPLDDYSGTLDGRPGDHAELRHRARHAASRSCRPRSTTPATTATSRSNAESRDDGQGAPRREVRRRPLHDRHRLLGRLDRPAHGRQRLPRASTRA